MIRSALSATRGLLAAALSIAVALLHLDHGPGVTLIAIAAALAVVLIVYIVGNHFLRSTPKASSYLMETGLLLLLIGSVIAGAALLVIAIQYAPPKDASERTKQIFAAVSVALAGYLGTVLIDPTGNLWNPVRTGIKRTFQANFKSKRDDVENDALNAVIADNGYGSVHAKGEVVSGWDWGSRRLRTRHIQRAVDKGYLHPPTPSSAPATAEKPHG